MSSFLDTAVVDLAGHVILVLEVLWGWLDNYPGWRDDPWHLPTITHTDQYQVNYSSQVKG